MYEKPKEEKQTNNLSKIKKSIQIITYNLKKFNQTCLISI